MSRLINVPNQKSGEQIIGTVVDERIIIVSERNNCYEPISQKYTDVTMGETQGSLQNIANDVASWISQARDAGYIQAQQEIHEALGME